MELKPARFNMIEQQIRPWDVLDQRVLDLLGQVARDDFVADEQRGIAYADTAIPIGHGQLMMHPKIEARMLQALNLHPTDKVLEVGTGSGYVTALLAKATRQVFSVDIIPEFLAQAEERLAVYGINNVMLEEGDAASGWSRHQLYDAIAVTGSLPVLPEAFQQSLNRQGRMFVITGTSPVMRALLIRRIGANEWSEEILFETDLPPLINAPGASRFEF